MSDDDKEDRNPSYYGPKVVPIGAPPSELSKVVEAVGRDIDMLIQAQAQLARVRRAAFEAYVKEGFTEEQALTLCVK